MPGSDLDEDFSHLQVSPRRIWQRKLGISNNSDISSVTGKVRFGPFRGIVQEAASPQCAERIALDDPSQAESALHLRHMVPWQQVVGATGICEALETLLV